MFINQNDGMFWTSLQGRSGSISLSLSSSLSELYIKCGRGPVWAPVVAELDMGWG